MIRSSIDWSGVGLALDQFLAGRFTYRSLEEWRERIRSGEILLNGTMVEPERRLELHDCVEYFPGDLPEPEADLRYRIAYEDETVLVVDKSGNLCAHPSGPFFRHTLWHLLSTRFGQIHLVNRLDRETSGLLLVAKNSSAAAKLGRPGWPVRKEYHKKLMPPDFWCRIQRARSARNGGSLPENAPRRVRSTRNQPGLCSHRKR